MLSLDFPSFILFIVNFRTECLRVSQTLANNIHIGTKYTKRTKSLTLDFFNGNIFRTKIFRTKKFRTKIFRTYPWNISRGVGA